MKYRKYLVCTFNKKYYCCNKTDLYDILLTERLKRGDIPASKWYNPAYDIISELFHMGIHVLKWDAKRDMYV